MVASSEVAEGGLGSFGKDIYEERCTRDVC